jgi:AraC-like DNA-binding protein
MKILSVHIVPFINYAVARGVSRERLLLQLEGITIDGDTKISKQQFSNVLDLICFEIKDDKLGLHVGKSLDFVTLGVIHQISLKSKTIEEGLYYCHSFLQSTFPYIMVKNTVVDAKRKVELSIKGFSKHHSKVILETIMMVMQRELQLMWNKKLKIESSSPFWDDQYPDTWSQGKSYAIFFPNKIENKLPDYSSMKLDLLLPAYLKFLEKLKGKQSFASRVKLMTLSLASPYLPNAPDVASQFNCSLRVFQRMLAQEQTSYRQLQDELKSELSLLLLKHEAFSVGDVATLLGYSEPAAFVRTFNKWYGVSPAKYRKLFSN